MCPKFIRKNNQSKNSMKAMNFLKQKIVQASTAFHQHKKYRIWGLYFILALLLVFSFIGGRNLAIYSFQHKKPQSVAFRIGNAQRYIDYDMLSAINFLKYKFQKAGFNILGTAYAGDLYPENLDDADINVFVRGFPIFFDLRLSDEKIDVFYLHRFSHLYVEELNQYDFYISSQQNLLNALRDKDNAHLLPFGAVPHKALIPDNYDYDVLYIYEYFNQDFYNFIQSVHNPKVYSGSQFAQLTPQDRENELKKAKVIVYEMGGDNPDDPAYVPYAVFDIISYGRPLLTNDKLLLSTFFNDNVWLFKDNSSMFVSLSQALNSSDDIREKKARAARRILLDTFDVNVPLLKNLSK